MPSVRSIHTLPGAALALVLAGGFAGAADTARWVMSFPSPTNNAVEFERRYGGVAFANVDRGACSTCSNSVFSTYDTSGSFVRWRFSNPNATRNNFSDQMGILLPLDPLWSWNHDLRKASSIRMKVRSNRSWDFRFGLEGPAAPFSSIGLLPENSFTARTTWRWITLDFMDFAENGEVSDDILGAYRTISLPDSLGRISVVSAQVTTPYCRLTNDPSGTDYDNDSANVLKHVRAFKIVPEGSDLLVQPVTLDIDSIVVEGIRPQWGRIRQSSACQGSAIVVDQHRPPVEYHIENMLGGRWERSLDTSTGNPNGVSTGYSSVGPQSVEEWPPSFVAQMDAMLQRVDPRLHPNAGWARLSTWLRPDSTPRSIPGLKAISFRVQAGSTAGWFDSTNIHGLTFRLHSSIVPDSVAYSVRIPYDSVRPAPGDSGRTICIQLDELRQPGWYTGKAGIHSIDPTTLTALSWTLSLDEPTASSSKPSRITLWDTKLWTEGTSGGKPAHGSTRPLQTRAIEGHLVVSAERGRNLHVQIRDLSGRVLLDRSLWASGSEQRVELPRLADVLVASVTDGSSRTHLRVLPR